MHTPQSLQLQDCAYSPATSRSGLSYLQQAARCSRRTQHAVVRAVATDKDPLLLRTARGEGMCG